MDFESKCLACHSIGQGRKLGPDLAGVTKRRTTAWLAKWLKAPEKMLESDAEIHQYIRYFQWADEQPRAGEEQKDAPHRKEGDK